MHAPAQADKKLFFSSLPYAFVDAIIRKITVMSGLEGLGAAANIVGVIGTVKTCIDLLGICAGLRSAERDLEDLFVHLQWQRIRFYCWAQETGFTEAIVEQETRQTIQVPEILAFLPHEFHLPLFLSHIKRSIDNYAAQSCRTNSREIFHQTGFSSRVLEREIEPLLGHESSAK